MKISLRPATADDFDFAFEAKRLAVGPHILARWSWDEDFQLDLRRKRWQERPWSIIEGDGAPIGTLSVAEHDDHFRFGEFRSLPTHPGQGIGTELLRQVLARADAASLPVKLEDLKWNPVGSLYRRHGFKVVAEIEIHSFLVRHPHVAQYAVSSTRFSHPTKHHTAPPEQQRLRAN
ncbi:hypothetical protein BURK2_04319 [Burkholderiales bacterium]|nr:MAG: GNAT family N-acetyltransferase [Burkholderiales bacterium]CAG1011647.1 hypothetical protein BURK2_04319 [Burkholderiales bacterium]